MMKKGKKKEALELIYTKYRPRMLKQALNYFKDKAPCEDIIQELFISLYLKDFYLNLKGSLASYLYASLHNKILNYLRDQSTYKRHTLAAFSDNLLFHNDIEDFISHQDLQNKIQIILNTMPVKYREVYILNRQDLLSVKQISGKLKRPVGTVEKQLQRGLFIIRTRLKQSN
ncbi:RNA polymerase sigma factor [Chitinophagaceae bacterium LWZ2-11]